MIELSGRYNMARVMIDVLDESTRAQIATFLDSPAFADSSIVVMPDCHAGKGAVIGTTMSLNAYVIPNIVGVDIGCGVLAARLEAGSCDFPALDAFIRREIPSGFEIRGSRPPWVDQAFLDRVEKTARAVGAEAERSLRSIGSLGGGNHFIEVDRDPGGSLWVVIHSGSRNFGKCIAKHFQERARSYCASLKGPGPGRELEYLPASHPDAKAYLAAMVLAQEYAVANRAGMMDRILGFLGQAPEGTERLESVHNYIDFRDGVLRKGAISARSGERCIIPLTMRDGSLVCRGRGNRAWNCSAPHGAGRAMSRHAARRGLDLDAFVRSMREAGVYTTTAGKGSLDEAPEAYKPKELILASIGETVELEFAMKSVYNFKATGD
jgi:RNA-splicing ligase RtcB